ncbi:MAG: DUF1269 domain-containing protein [bacterium]|nr:DUF1269 domain-containing protein [bacterium]
MTEANNNTLIVAAFGDLFQADQALISMIKLQAEHRLDLEDAVVVYKTADGRTRVKQTMELTAADGASIGAWMGLLVGLLLGGPLGGLISGAVAGALISRLNDYGIDNKFIKEVEQEIQPGNSALFILVKQRPTDALTEELKRFDAKILRTNLAPLLEAILKRALQGEVPVDDTPEETTASEGTTDTPPTENLSGS